MKDIEIVKDMLDKHIHLDTISYKYLEDFQFKIKGSEALKFSTIRTRFRKALNELHYQKYCTKSYIGTSAYQTSDSLGGKSCIVYSKIFK